MDYNSDGSVSVWEEYEYDALGNQTKSIGYYSDGTVKEWWEREYDTLGNKIKEKKIINSGDYNVYSICENEYINIYVENR